MTHTEETVHCRLYNTVASPRGRVLHTRISCQRGSCQVHEDTTASGQLSCCRLKREAAPGADVVIVKYGGEPRGDTVRNGISSNSITSRTPPPCVAFVVRGFFSRSNFLRSFRQARNIMSAGFHQRHTDGASCGPF